MGIGERACCQVCAFGQRSLASLPAFNQSFGTVSAFQVDDSTDGDWWRGCIDGSPETEGLIPKNHARALFPEELKLISTQTLVLDYAYATSDSSIPSSSSSQIAPESPRIRPEKVAPAPPSRGNSSVQLVSRLAPH